MKSLFPRPALKVSDRLATPVTALAVLVMLITGPGCENGQSTSNYAAANPASYDQFDQGARLPPTPRTLYSMARLLSAQGQDQEAVFVLTRTLEEHPNHVPAYNALAEIYIRQDRLADAVDVIEKGLEISPGNAVLLNNRGMAALFEEDYRLAASYFSRAAEAQDDARFSANEALALAMQGEYEHALKTYERAVPEATAYYNVAVAAEARGDTDYATEAFNRARVLRAGGRSGVRQ